MYGFRPIGMSSSLNAMMTGYQEDTRVYPSNAGDISVLADRLMKGRTPTKVRPRGSAKGETVDFKGETSEDMKKNTAETKKTAKPVSKPAKQTKATEFKPVKKPSPKHETPVSLGSHDAKLTVPQGIVEEDVKPEVHTNDASQYMTFHRDTTWKLFVICNGVFNVENFNSVRRGMPDQDYRRENLFVINNGNRRIDLSRFGIDFMNTAEVPGWKDFGPKYSEFSVFYNLATLFRDKIASIPAVGFVHYDMHTGTGFRENPSLYSAIEFTYMPQSEKWGLMMFSFEEYTKMANQRIVMDYDQPQIFRYSFGHDLMYADRYGYLHNMCDTCMQILNSEYHLAIGDPDRFTSAKLSGGNTYLVRDASFLCGSDAALDIMDMVRRVIDSDILKPFENSTFERAIAQYLSCLVGIYSTKYSTRTCFSLPHDAVLSRMEKLRA